MFRHIGDLLVTDPAPTVLRPTINTYHGQMRKETRNEILVGSTNERRSQRARIGSTRIPSGCVDGWVRWWMRGWTSGWMGGWVGGCVEEWVEWMRGWVEEWMEWMRGWSSGWMRGWVDAWVDAWVDECDSYVTSRRRQSSSSPRLRAQPARFWPPFLV